MNAAVLLGTDPSLPRGAQPPELCFKLTDFVDRVAATEQVNVDGPTVDVVITEI